MLKKRLARSVQRIVESEGKVDVEAGIGNSLSGQADAQQHRFAFGTSCRGGGEADCIDLGAERTTIAIAYIALVQ